MSALLMGGHPGVTNYGDPRSQLYGGAQHTTSSGGSGGYGSGSMGALGAQYSKAWADAKAANEARYAELKKGYTDRYSRGMANLSGLFTADRQDAKIRHNTAGGKLTQDMIGRGLRTSTAHAAGQRAVNRDAEQQIQRIDQDEARLRLDTDARLDGDRLGVIERRTDAYPDLNQMLSLAKLSGQGSGGSGGGGTGGYLGGVHMRQTGTGIKPDQQQMMQDKIAANEKFQAQQKAQKERAAARDAVFQYNPNSAISYNRQKMAWEIRKARGN